MRVRRRHVVTFSAFAVATAVVWFLWNQTSVVPNQVSRQLTENLLRQHGLRLELDGVAGTLAGTLALHHPRLVAADDSSRVVLQADALRVQVRRPLRILRGEVRIATLRLDRPRVNLDVLPMFGGGVSAERGGFPRIAIEDLVIHRGSFIRNGRLVAQEVEAHLGLESKPERVQIELRNAQAVLGADTLRVTRSSGAATWEGDSLHVDVLQLVTGSSAIATRGTYALEERRVTATSEWNPLAVTDVARFVKLPIKAGALTGPVSVRWSDSRLRVEGKLTGTLDGHALEDVAFDVVQDGERVVVRHAAGRVDGQQLEVEGEFQGEAVRATANLVDVDVRRLWPGAAAWPEHRLSGAVSVSRAHASDSLRIVTDLGASTVRGVRVERAQVRLAGLGKEWRIDNARIETALGSANLRGTASEQGLAVEFEAETGDLGGILRAAGTTGPSGDATARGRVFGSKAAPSIEADVAFDSIRYEGARLRQGTLALWGENLRRNLNFVAELRADTIAFENIALRDLGADFAWRDGILHLTRSQAGAGDTLVALVATVQPRAHDWMGARAATTFCQLETALLQFGSNEIRVEDPAAVWVRGRAVHVDSLRLTTRGGSLRLDGDLDLAARTVAARAAVSKMDLDFLARALHLPHTAHGSASGWIAAHGNLDRAQVAGEMLAVAGAWNGLPFDTLAVRVGSTPQATVIEHLRLVSPHGTLDGTVRVGWLPALDRRAQAARVRADLVNESIVGALRLDGLALERVWQARAAAMKPPDWRARLDGAVEVSGTVGDPRATARGSIDDLKLGGKAMGHIGFDLAIEAGQLVIRDLAVVSGEQTLHANGSLPVRADLTQRPEILRDQPLSGRVVLPRSSFTVLERFVDLFESPPGGLPRGEIEATLTVAGSVAKPELGGAVGVFGASFMLRDLEEIYRDVNATGEFGGGKLTFTSLNGNTGGGRVNGSGQVEFAHWRVKGYALDFDLDRITVWSVPEMSALVSGRLTVEGKEAGGEDPIPELRGKFDVLEAEITQEFTNTETGAPVVETDRPEWLCDLELRASKGRVWVRNSQIDAELAGNIGIRRSTEGLDYRGLATVRRGNYTLPFVRFKITRGELDFSRHPGLDPEFDVEAETGKLGERTYVTLTGSLSRPRLDFRSDRSELTSEQVQQQLAQVGKEDASVAIADVAEQAIRDLQLLEHFSIDPSDRTSTRDNTAGESTSSILVGYNVSAGRSLSDRVFLVYTQGVKSDIQQRVALEVDLNRWLLVESAYERRTILEVDQPQNAFDVNFKYRHEY